ncbi:MAG: response regulator [Chloroflexota bacterium]|nr:MAG: response regulator [Chloroflexota bacterium]
MWPRVSEATPGRRLPKILCADDSPDIRALVRHTLARDAIDVVTAVNGADALEALAHFRADAILLDIDMPIIDGLEVLARLRSDPHLAATPVMMLTADGDAANVRRALADGARDYVVKPFTADVLRQRVRRLLQTPPVAADARVKTGPTRPRARVAARVLIVDGEPASLRLARAALADRCTIATARSGAGALAVAAEVEPDVIVMDLDMPIMDGYEAVVRLRQMPALVRTRIIAMVPEDAPSDISVDGFDGVLRKPFTGGDLARTVCRYLGVDGLYSFVEEDDMIVLRFHESKLCETADSVQTAESVLANVPRSTGFWEARDVDQFQHQFDLLIARLVDSGGGQIMIDLERARDLPDRHVGTLVSVLRTIARRLTAIGLPAVAVTTFPMRARFEPVRTETGIDICWRKSDAIASLRRQTLRLAETGE